MTHHCRFPYRATTIFRTTLIYTKTTYVTGCMPFILWAHNITSRGINGSHNAEAYLFVYELLYYKESLLTVQITGCYRHVINLWIMIQYTNYVYMCMIEYEPLISRCDVVDSENKWPASRHLNCLCMYDYVSPHNIRSRKPNNHSCQ